MSALAVLRGCGLFRGFSETGLQIFAAVARERALAAGASLFAEGQPGASLFVVRSGTLRVLARGPDGDRELAQAREGDHVGALSLLAPGPRLVAVVAATDCELVEIGAADFARLQPDKPKACLKLALAIAADVARRGAESRDLLRAALERAGSGR
jgi:CRP-like cAMP-binding protein